MERKKKRKKVWGMLMLLFILICSSMTTQAATKTTSKKLIQGQTWTPKIKAKKVKWNTSNKRVASVSSKGKITVRHKGTVTITARAGKNIYKYKIKAYAHLTKNQAEKAVMNYCKKRYGNYCCYGTEKKGSNYWVWIRYGTGAQGKYVVNIKTGKVKSYEPYWGGSEDPNMPVTQVAEFQALSYL